MVNSIVVTDVPRGERYWPNPGGLRQVLFEWRGIRIYSYPAMLYLGLTVGVIVGNYVANLARMDTARVLIATMLLTISGMVGARLLFVATHWTVYRREPRRIFRRSEGGAANQGGLIMAVSISPPIFTALQLPFGAFWDVTTFVMLIWLIFGRFGCVLHGCCSGRPSAACYRSICLTTRESGAVGSLFSSWRLAGQILYWRELPGFGIRDCFQVPFFSRRCRLWGRSSRLTASA